MKKSIKKKYKGFTLVEMLVVLAIISLLMLLFIPNLSNQRKKAETHRDEALIKVIDTQVELYKLDNKGTTPTYSELVAGDYITEDQKEKAEEKNIPIK